MLRLRSVNDLIRRHRRVTALVGLLIVLGVAALNAHEALPEHHEHHGVATVCIAALSIATLAALGWGARHDARPVSSVRLVCVARTPIRFDPRPPRALARAGPPGRLPLRL